nr:hypothetical protein [Lachnospiraceae bacterium]
MYKLKNTYIDRMISNKLSSKEIDFILYIADSQNDSGRIESVYYKDVCNSIHVSIQKFYDILNSLTDKKMISYEKIHRADVSVILLGNDFSKVDYEKDKIGYMNVAASDFRSEKFIDMKAGSKLLYLYTQRFIQGKHMLLDNFYDEFSKLFKVAKKSLQQYIHELKEKKLLFINKKRNKSYNYEMTMKRSTVLYHKQIIEREKEFYVNNIAMLIKRNFNRFLPKMESDKITHDIANLADTKRAEKHHNFISLIVDAIKESIRQQKDEGKTVQVL